MSEDRIALYAVVAIAVAAIVGIGIAAASFATDESLGSMMGGGYHGGMMGGTTYASTPGSIEWALLILSVAFLGLAIFLLFGARGAPRGSSASPAHAAPLVARAAAPPAASATPAVPPAPPVPPPSAPEAVAETALVKLLNEDERRMYLEIRDHGGEMLQRDLVAVGTFSKAKVTRVLDKLEAKGIVVREAHGMTNRVRLVRGASR